ncbi:MAG: EscU/YscU/HrcU family type III secretion system export apparatus switch protein [Alkalispirochaeta sp.]
MDKPVAVALRYDDSLPAPFVTAGGTGALAEKMIEIARRHGVPVQTAPELADRLILLRPHEIIPEELYPPVAQIFAFLMQIEENLKRKNDRKNASDSGN